MTHLEKFFIFLVNSHSLNLFLKVGLATWTLETCHPPKDKVNLKITALAPALAKVLTPNAARVRYAGVLHASFARQVPPSLEISAVVRPREKLDSIRSLWSRLSSGRKTAL
jgi:hypothetical protein